MKAHEVLKILRITRPTLTKYVQQGIIKTTKLPNGRYDYDEKSVYQFLNKNIPKKIVAYGRVSTAKQKTDLSNQIEMIKSFSIQNGWTLNAIYQDIASGISFEKRKEFFELLDKVLNNEIDKVIITYKDRLSRVGFELFSTLFKKFGTDIIVISEVGSEKLDSKEIFEEIVSLLHCYSMKLYSNRKKKSLYKT
jgi:predicted site-specific integrase-resolvase